MAKSSKRKKKIQQSASQADVLDADIQQVYAHAVEQHQQGNHQEAARLYQMILANKPDHADSLHYLGVLAFETGSSETACELIREAIRINSSQAIYHYNLATVCKSDGQATVAIKHYKKAVKLQPDHIDAYTNLATIYHEMENFALARQANMSALKIDPKSIAALHNIGTLMNEAGQYDEAIEYFDRVILCDPMHIEARFKKAHIRLLKGDYSKGWQGYSWMFFSSSYLENNPNRLIPFPKWNGSSLEHKRLLVNADQGIGDELMFASCLPDAMEISGSVVVECNPRLVSLYQRSFPGIDIIPAEKKQDFYWHQGLGEIDYRINLSGLAEFFRGKESDFPQHQGYILPDTAKVNDWRERLNTLGDGINIGISWRGGANDRTRKARSIPLNYWKKLSSLPGINIINLQYGQHDEEIEKFNQQATNPLHTFDDIDPLTDLDGFSALIASLDLVISIDNSTVHFAGAVGTPTWAILPHTPDWRWMIGRGDSPWYPSLKLFRAEKMGFDGLKKQLNVIVRELNHLLENEASPNNGLISPSLSTDKGQETSTSDSPVLTMSTESDYALLLNDTTAWYHWGCSCTSLAIHKQLRQRWEAVVSIPIIATRLLSPFPTAIEHFDDAAFFDSFCSSHPELIAKITQASAVYINGEGTLHLLNQTTLSLLYLAYIAKTKMGKMVSIMNHSCYPNGSDLNEQSPAFEIYQKVYQSLEHIAVREVISVEEVKRMNVPVVQSFDCLPLFIESMYDRHSNDDRSNDRKDIVIAGSVSWKGETMKEVARLVERLHQQGFRLKLLVGASANIAGDDARFVQALKDILGVSCEFVFARSEQEWLSTIENAQLLISGRFHHSIAAAFLHTPFIVMSSNTSKIKGMMKMLDIETFVSVEESDLAAYLADRALTLLQKPEAGLLDDEIRESMLALAQKNFEMIS